MARKSRTNRSPELKAKVALAAVQGAHTTAQLASLHGVHPVQIAQWKKQLVAGAASVFATGVKTSDTGRTDLEEELFARIGRLDMELEWLKKKLSGVG
jgi:transposase-like protein